MAFADGTLVAITNSNKNAGNVWFYKENATLAAIRAANYFNDAVDYGMVDGDIVMLAASDGFGFNDIVVTGSNYTVGEAITSA